MLEFCTSIMSKSFVPYLARIILDELKRQWIDKLLSL